MNSSDTRISTYLDDLARMLADLPPDERDDVLAGVREHLDASLAEHLDDPGAVDAALLRLGPPERIAAEARAETPSGPRAARATTPQPSTPRLARAGAVVVAVSVLLPTLTMGADRAQQLLAPDRMSMSVGLSFFLLVLMGTPWLAGVTCVLLARGLTSSTRLWLTLLGPAAAVVVLAGSFWREPQVVSAVVSAVAAVAVVIGTLVLAARAWREVGQR